jgi:hypothetical protein
MPYFNLIKKIDVKNDNLNSSFYRSDLFYIIIQTWQHYLSKTSIFIAVC